MTRPRRLLAAVSLLALTLALAVPATRWVAVGLARGMVGLSNPVDNANETARLLGGSSPAAPAPAAGASAPYLLQLAAAIGQDPSTAADRLEALARRHPDRAAVRAHILRYACSSRLRLSRTESDTLTGAAPRASASATPRDVLLTMERHAAVGERLDPGNAYFPYMRALCLLALRRDGAALAAVRRAGAMPRWTDYALEEPDARRAAVKASGIRMSATGAMLVDATTLFPHYAQMREGARVLTQLAANMEAAGRPKEGIALRHSLMRYGSLMRAQSPTLIGTLVGLALTAVATGRPGNAPYEKRPATISVDEWTARRISAYAGFALRHAGDAEARWVRDELDRANHVRAALRQDIDSMPYGPQNMVALAALWTTGILVLGWAAAMLAAGALAHGLGQRRGAGWMLAVAMAVLTVVLAWRFGRWALGAVEAWYAIESMGDGEAGSNAPAAIAYAVAGLLACLPPLVAGPVALVARARRKPVMPAVGRGMVTAGLLTLVAFVGVVALTSASEAAVLADVERCRAHEARYMLARVGQPWPEAAPLQVTRPD